MPDHTVDLPHITLNVRETGDPAGPPVVFVHGLLVNGTLWRDVAAPLAAQGHRCLAPDLPLGCHAHPFKPGADRTPRGVAHLIADLLEALDLDDVTLVANDTGGAITQMLMVDRPARIGRVVLTNCDCFENFLPPAFRPLQWLAKARVLGLFLEGLRSRTLARTALGYGLLSHRKVPDELLDSWRAAYFADRGVRKDAIRVTAAIDNRDTLDAAERLKDFAPPVLIAWAYEDRFFTAETAERLAAQLPDARIERIADSLTFSAIDQPERLAALIAQFTAAGAGNHSAGSTAGTAPMARGT